jgi:hypothetical protein
MSKNEKRTRQRKFAKRKPPKFNLESRAKEKADCTARRWKELKMDGEFAESRVYWKNGNKGDQQHGWGEFFHDRWPCTEAKRSVGSDVT